jgi:hypothetical protein
MSYSNVLLKRLDDDPEALLSYVSKYRPCPVHRWSLVRSVKVSVVGALDGTVTLVMSRTSEE